MIKRQLLRVTATNAAATALGVTASALALVPRAQTSDQ